LSISYAREAIRVAARSRTASSVDGLLLIVVAIVVPVAVEIEHVE
jgi:hypothetical protein